MKRTFDYYFRLLTDAGLGWDEAVQVAREMVTPSARVGA